jgi:hypothetical protein
MSKRRELLATGLNVRRRPRTQLAMLAAAREGA